MQNGLYHIKTKAWYVWSKGFDKIAKIKNPVPYLWITATHKIKKSTDVCFCNSSYKTILNLKSFILTVSRACWNNFIKSLCTDEYWVLFCMEKGKEFISLLNWIFRKRYGYVLRNFCLFCFQIATGSQVHEGSALTKQL